MLDVVKFVPESRQFVAGVVSIASTLKVETSLAIKAVMLE
jgi:hypothetical protein